MNYEDHYEVCHLLGRCCLALLQEGSQQCRACLLSRLEDSVQEYKELMGDDSVVPSLLQEMLLSASCDSHDISRRQPSAWPLEMQ